MNRNRWAGCSGIRNLIALTVVIEQFPAIAALGYGGVFATELAIQCAVLALMIYAAVLFFRKKRGAPKAIITFLTANFVAANLIVLVEVVFGLHEFIVDSMTPVLQTLFLAAVWIPYFVISKRVKATFIK